MPRPVIRKVDGNQTEIVEAFRKLGYSVAITSMVGKGFVDAVAGKFGHNYMLEIKDGSLPPSKRKLTPDEEKFHAEWRGSIHIIESLSDVIEFDRKHSRRHQGL